MERGRLLGSIQRIEFRGWFTEWRCDAVQGTDLAIRLADTAMQSIGQLVDSIPKVRFGMERNTIG